MSAEPVSRLAAGRRARVTVLLLGTLCACRPTAGARIEVDRTLLHVFGDGLSTLPVRLVESDGSEASLRRASLTPKSPALLAVSDTLIACRSQGITQVIIRFRGKTHWLDVACRAAPLNFRMVEIWSLDVTDPPRTVRFYAHWGGRTPDERVQPVFVRAKDTTVAQVRGDTLRGVGVGRTEILADMGGMLLHPGVQVTHRLVEDTVRFVPHDFRKWELAKGFYALTMRRSPPRLGATGFEVITDGARCSRRPGDEDTIYCAVTDTGSLSVYSVATDARRAREYATVDLWKLP